MERRIAYISPEVEICAEEERDVITASPFEGDIDVFEDE